MWKEYIELVGEREMGEYGGENGGMRGEKERGVGDVGEYIEFVGESGRGGVNGGVRVVN